ncbi:MAG: hypothetical protein ABF243_02150 [Celeribacter marinus]
MLVFRTVLAFLAALTLVACGEAKMVTQETPKLQLGDFSFGHNIVVADGMQKGVFSRTAEPDEIKDSLTTALADRLGRYDGDKLYHLGIKVEAYALAMPGIPIVFKPKSAYILTVTAWDDAAGGKLNEEPRLLTIFEGTSAQTLIGSGITRNKQEQIDVLSRNAARRIERWLEENGDWFGVASVGAEITQEDDTAAALELLAANADPDALAAAQKVAAEQQAAAQAQSQPQ